MLRGRLLSGWLLPLPGCSSSLLRRSRNRSCRSLSGRELRTRLLLGCRLRSLLLRRLLLLRSLLNAKLLLHLLQWGRLASLRRLRAATQLLPILLQRTLELTNQRAGLHDRAHLLLHLHLQRRELLLR